jgi:hypothetical protein
MSLNCKTQDADGRNRDKYPGWQGSLTDRLSEGNGPQHAPLFSRPRPGFYRLVAPYGTDFFATTMRVSNARAARELSWQPVAAPTHHEGIQRAIQALGQ